MTTDLSWGYCLLCNIWIVFTVLCCNNCLFCGYSTVFTVLCSDHSSLCKYSLWPLFSTHCLVLWPLSFTVSIVLWLLFYIHCTLLDHWHVLWPQSCPVIIILSYVHCHVWFSDQCIVMSCAHCPVLVQLSLTVLTVLFCDYWPLLWSLVCTLTTICLVTTVLPCDHFWSYDDCPVLLPLSCDHCPV